jgi:hypothetical protein
VREFPYFPSTYGLVFITVLENGTRLTGNNVFPAFLAFGGFHEAAFDRALLLEHFC